MMKGLNDEAVSKVFLPQRRKVFSQSAQRTIVLKSKHCDLCVNPLRPLRLMFFAF